MPQAPIELKQRRDIGEIISTFFDFFKIHLKPYLNIFIRYNGVFILGFLGVSYLLVTGFVGSFRSSGIDILEQDKYDLLVGIGFVGFILLYTITAAMNYSLAASYITNYDKDPSKPVDFKQTWKMITKNLGKIILYIILLVVLIIPMVIASFIIGIIPVVGFFGQIFIRLAYTAWMGVGFMTLFNENREVTDGLGEGWRLITAHFWKSVIVNLVIGILMGILMLLVLTVPGVLIGIYAFHSLENGVDLAESPVATVIWTLALSILLILYTFIQSVTQMGNGVLYFSLHEETYNVNTRKRIEQIGVHE